VHAQTQFGAGTFFTYVKMTIVFFTYAHLNYIFSHFIIMSEEEESISSARLPYTVPNLSNMAYDDSSTDEEDSLPSLPPPPRRISSRSSASPYRTADRVGAVAASQRLQLAQRSTRPRLGTIHVLPTYVEAVADTTIPGSVRFLF